MKTISEFSQDREQTYYTIRQSIVTAQHKLNAAVNSAMVIAIGRLANRYIKHVEKMIGRSMARNY